MGECKIMKKMIKGIPIERLTGKPLFLFFIEYPTPLITHRWRVENLQHVRPSKDTEGHGGTQNERNQEFSLVLNNRQEKGEKQDVFVRSEKSIFLKADYLFWSENVGIQARTGSKVPNTGSFTLF